MGKRIARVVKGEDGQDVLRVLDDDMYEVTDDGVDIEIGPTFAYFLESLVTEVIDGVEPLPHGGGYDGGGDDE